MAGSPTGVANPMIDQKQHDDYKTRRPTPHYLHKEIITSTRAEVSHL